MILLGLVLIWLGGFATGLVIGFNPTLTLVPRSRPQTSDLYPKKNNNEPDAS